MGSFFRSSLRMKLLTALVVILAVCFAGLSYFIVKKQNGLLSEMSTDVARGLTETGKKAAEDFTGLKSRAGTLLEELRDRTSQGLSQATQTALAEEENRIKKTLETLLVKNGENLAALLSDVASGLIMKDNTDELDGYSKAAAKTDEIVYALFLDKDGNKLPGNVNLLDERIVSYIKRGEDDEGDFIDKVLKYSKEDPEVLIIEKTIEFYEIPVGKTLICLDRTLIEREISDIAARFASLKEANETRVRAALEEESGSVLEAINTDLVKVQEGNARSIKETEALLSSAVKTVSSATANIIMVVGGACCLIILFLIGLLLRRSVISPIKEISEGLRDTAEGEGDLTKRLATDRTDEIGVLAGWFNAFLERLNAIIVDIRGNAETVTAASDEVLSVAGEISRGADHLSQQANTVAAAAEEMSANMNSVAAASEQASINVTVVADAASQMKDTLSEVAQNCDRARSIADSASDRVSVTTEKVSRLGDAARAISKVTEVITEIAEQTNLLALNATIEAARAGDAGKGFAVVASEIKSLAAQTGQATLNIRSQIQGIQDSTDETVREVSSISGVIADVNEIVSTIAAAIEEQSAAAAEVAMNIDQASRGIEAVNENVAQSSQVSAEIARDITGVNEEAGQMFERSGRMNASASDLSDLAAVLRDMISVFKVSIDATDTEKGNAGSEKATNVRDLMTWGKAFETGITDIDDQHRNLMGMINDLHRAMKQKKGARKSGVILKQLAEYTVYHFSHEEELFDRHNYPDSAPHKDAHRKLIRQVTDFQTAFESGTATLTMDLMDFLKDWLKHHIMETDMKYAPFFKEKGL